MNEETLKLVRNEARSVYSEMSSLDQFRINSTSSHVHNGVDAPQVSQDNIIPSIRTSGNITMATQTTYTIRTISNPTSVWFYGLAYKTATIFTVTAANATVGATYTNNSQTFTVLATIAGATTLYCVGTGAPAANGTLTKATGTGDATIAFSAFTTQIITRVHCVGNAQLGSTFYLQPGTSTSVVVGGIPQTTIQSSTMFLVDSFAQETINGVVTPIVRALADEGHIVDVEYSGIQARASITAYGLGYITVVVSNLSTGWTIQGNWVIT